MAINDVATFGAALAPVSVSTMSSNTAQHNQSEVAKKRSEMMFAYKAAIAAGHDTFWTIPTSNRDTAYVAFLLNKSSSNDSILEEAFMVACDVAGKYGQTRLCQRDIREWVYDPTSAVQLKNEAWKAKGVLIDCGHPTAAYHVHQALQELLAKQPKAPTNFTRLVLPEFGEPFMAVMAALKEKRLPKIAKELKHRPQGPKWQYKDGEPSIDSGAQSFAGSVVRYGEWSTVAGTELNDERDESADEKEADHGREVRLIGLHRMAALGTGFFLVSFLEDCAGAYGRLKKQHDLSNEKLLEVLSKKAQAHLAQMDALGRTKSRTSEAMVPLTTIPTASTANDHANL